MTAEYGKLSRSQVSRVCASLARSVIHGCVEALAEEAEQQGGSLTRDQIMAFGNTDLLDESVLASLVSEHFAFCMNAIEVERRQRLRTNLVGRILVEQFLDDFAGDAGAAADPDEARSRIGPLIGAFLSSVESILGPEVVDGFNDECLNLRDQLFEQDGTNFSNESFMEALGIRQVRWKILAIMAHYFNAHYEDRRDAFINAMNFAMAQAEGGDALPAFGSGGYVRLMQALYREMENPNAEVEAALSDCFGAEDRKAVAQLLWLLKKDARKPAPAGA